jgi:hypothetical protein
VAVGAEAVAANIMRYWAGRTMVSVPLGPERAVVLGFLQHRLAAVIELHIEDGVIRDIHATVDPGQLTYLRRFARAIPSSEAGPDDPSRGPEARPDGERKARS